MVIHASVAQSVEQGTENPCVGGSIPPRGTNFVVCDGIGGFAITIPQHPRHQMEKLQKVTVKEKEEFWQVLQEYLREIAPFYENLKGFFEYPRFDKYFTNQLYFAYWLVSSEEKVGFAMVYEVESGLFELAEFYLFKKSRLRGHVTTFIKILLDKHKGRWQFCVSKNNKNVLSLADKLPYQKTKSQGNRKDEYIFRFEVGK